MTPSLLAVTAALAIGLPAFALGEYLRERRGRRLSNLYTPPTRKDIP